MGFRAKIAIAVIAAVAVMFWGYGVKQYHAALADVEAARAEAALDTHERARNANTSNGDVDDDRDFLNDFLRTDED